MIEYDRVLIKRTRGRRLNPYVLVICQKLSVKIDNVGHYRWTLLVNFSYKNTTTTRDNSTISGDNGYVGGGGFKNLRLFNFIKF